LISEGPGGLPILIRGFGSRDGRLARKPATGSIDGFLEHQERCGYPAPSCQDQGEFRYLNVSYSDLRELFKQRSEKRKLVVNVLDLPISHDPELMEGTESRKFLDSDVLKFTRSAPKKAEDLRKGVKSLSEQLWMLLSSLTSFSGVHMDHKGRLTWVEVIEGMKLWFLIENTPENRKIRKQYGEFGGVHLYSRIICVLLRPGDLLIMKPGTLHAVYTVEDTLAEGGHFLHPRFLVESLEMADMSLKYSNFTNEGASRKDVKEEFSNLIAVINPSLFVRLTFEN
jgi:hypothetical protein